MLFLYISLKIFLKLILILLITIAVFLIIPFFYEIQLIVSTKWSCLFKIKWGKAIGIKGNFESGDIKDISIVFFNNVVKLPFGLVKKSRTKKKTQQKEVSKNGKIGEVKKITSKTKLKKVRLLDKELLCLLLKYIKWMLKMLKPKVFNIDIKYGFSDPFITGILSGFAYSLECSYLNNINTEPCFDKEVVIIDMEVSGVINTWCIFIKTLFLLLNRQIIKKLISFKKSETFN